MGGRAGAWEGAGLQIRIKMPFTRAELLYRRTTLTGFVLGCFLSRRSLAEIGKSYVDLGRLVKARVLDARVARVYPIKEIATALAHAEQGESGGKILVAPNGTI